ncbi:MAG TPA: alginate export family protein [Pseudomonadales bacterium]|nr:alginate export family protein [Pseudomonadales bacterium]MDP7316177.1 alginate export family protein [Pseudomonadales bacterium]HJP51745.1 alginate export family protein [Pseudomonadales bacterium]
MQLRVVTSLAVTCLVLMAAPFESLAESSQPWKLNRAMGTPDWLILEGTHRTRYESLDSQFRLGRTGSDQVLVLRTTMKATLGRGPFVLVGEMIDSRAELNDSGSMVNTSIVNSVEPLQAYVQWRDKDLFSKGSRSDLRLGRFTMDVGSRRFVARSRYRNTLSAFSGADWKWRGEGGDQWRVFYTLPVYRLPTFAGDLRDNERKLDEVDTEVKFWGIHYATDLSWGDRGEFFYFGIDEDDSPGRVTRNRDLATIGFRMTHPTQVAQFDHQIESAFQFGESRLSSSSTVVGDLDHTAYFLHLELGYTFNSPWQPRLIAQYDYASGDGDPLDSDNERFESLFGARRFDFGPTGIYGPFSRTNLKTFGFRLQLKPGKGFSGFISHRAYWLASDKDTWATTGLQDVDGDSGTYLGQQIEVRGRWNLRPGNIRLEAGIAHLFADEFRDDVPTSNRQGDSTYVYSQVSLSF